MARVRRIITEGSAYFERQLEKDDGIDLFRDDARFTSEHEVEAGGSAIEFRHALLASGAKPGLPAIPGIDTVPVVTSDDLLEATALPEHLVCVGAGAVGLEFAQAYRRLGATATVVQRGPHIASGEDAELADMLQGYLEEEGIHISTRAACNHLQPDGDCVRVDCVDGESVTADRVLVATGRVPDVERLALAQAGVETGSTGVTVDDELRTTQPHIYAIGDATGGLMFTHVATYEAPIAIANMLDGAHERPDYRVIPRAIFTDPELTGAGLSEQAARDSGYEVEIRRHDVRRIGKSRAIGDSRGRVKFVLDAKTGEILGVHILSRHGADLLPGPMVAMSAPERSLAPLLATIHAHPTLSETVKVAARED